MHLCSFLAQVLVICAEWFLVSGVHVGGGGALFMKCTTRTRFTAHTLRPADVCNDTATRGKLELTRPFIKRDTGLWQTAVTARGFHRLC